MVLSNLVSKALVEFWKEETREIAILAEIFNNFFLLPKCCQFYGWKAREEPFQVPVSK